jgi:hypothetical protein
MGTQNAVGSPGTVSAASGGYTYAINNLSTTPQSILGIDPQRVSITVHNPGSIDAFFAPVFVQNTGADVALVPTTSALGGCYRIFANGGTLFITGECQKAWQAFSASASGNPLTVEVSRI